MDILTDKTLLLLLSDAAQEEIWENLVRAFGVKSVKDLSFPSPTHAVIDLKRIKKGELAELVKKNPSLQVALLSQDPFTPSTLSLLKREEGVKWVLPAALSEQEIEGVIRALFGKEVTTPEFVPSEELIQRYQTHIHQKLGELFEALDSLKNSFSKGALKMLRTEAHKIAGSGTAYGFQSLGNVCRAIDIYLTPILEGDKTLPKNFYPLLESYLRRALFAVQGIVLLDFSPQEELPSLPRTSRLSSYVYLVTPDALVQKKFSHYAATHYLSLVGEIDPHHALEWLKTQDELPSCLILEIAYPAHRLSVEDFLTLLPKDKRPLIGVIVTDLRLEKAVMLAEEAVDFVIRKPIESSEIEEIFRAILYPVSISFQRALIIDDDPDAAHLLQEALKLFHVESDLLSDEKEILHTLRIHSYQLLFLDLGLQTYSGYQLLKVLRSDFAFRQLIIVIYTASRSQEVLLKCAELGADDVLFKPLVIDDLRSKLLILKEARHLCMKREQKSLLESIELFTKRVDVALQFAIPGVRFCLMWLRLGDVHSLQEAYGEELLKQIMQGVVIEIQASFPRVALWGKVKEDILGFLMQDETSGKIEFEFDNFLENFFKDVQVYTSIETPLRFFGGVCLFHTQSSSSYASLVPFVSQALSEAEKKEVSSVVIINPPGGGFTFSETPQVILVDDDLTLTELMEQAFHQAGFQVESFHLGQEALDYFGRLPTIPTKLIVILDRILPDMDGVELLRTLQVRFGRTLKVLFLSSLSAEEDMLKGLGAGAIDYVTKPFNMRVLIKKCQALIQV